MFKKFSEFLEGKKISGFDSKVAGSIRREVTKGMDLRTRVGSAPKGWTKEKRREGKNLRREED